jgi:hypothetical protein
MFSKLIACGEFVKRQTPESGYSHFEGTWEELEELAEKEFGSYLGTNLKPGYRDGVVLMDLPADRFRSAIVELDKESKLTANYAPRRLGEDAFIRISAKAKKQSAKHASVVLYRHDVLAENNERETEAEWEIVAIKARVTEEEEPMDPYTMARNFLHLKGGTKGDFTSQQFAESILYWNNHCMTTGKPKWYRKVVEFFRQLRLDVCEAGLCMWDNLRNLKG